MPQTPDIAEVARFPAIHRGSVAAARRGRVVAAGSARADCGAALPIVASLSGERVDAVTQRHK
jgi:hypothetical protein